MEIGVFWRKFRNVEFQRKLTTENTYDDAYEEGYQHYMALKEAGYDACMIEWKHDPLETLESIKNEKVDLVFNVSSLEEITFLETFNIPYVGSSIDLVSIDKVVRKKIILYNDLATPRFVIAYDSCNIPKIDLEYPLFIKPINGRGSAGISEENVIYNSNQISKIVSKITNKIGQPALIEEFIEGREITVGITGYKKPRVLHILEIEYNSTITNTYEHKMFDNEILHCPAKFTKKEEEIIKETALDIYKTLDAKDFSRIDMILGKDGIPYFLEINTFAGLTMQAGEGEKHVHLGYMGSMAKAEGFTRGEFIKSIVESAIERYNL